MKAVIIALALTITACLACAGPVGSTSEWGIIIRPCASCWSTNKLEVHHVWPQHVYPEYAHDTNRMICLCRKCHLAVGHDGNFTNVVTNLVIILLNIK